VSLFKQAHLFHGPALAESPILAHKKSCLTQQAQLL